MPPELYGPAGALAVLAFVVVAFIRGDIAPGYAYRREQARADRADAALLAILMKARPDDGSPPNG
jgi:hypothetical protein